MKMKAEQAAEDKKRADMEAQFQAQIEALKAEAANK